MQSTPAQEVQDPVAPEPMAGMVEAQPGLPSTTDQLGSVPESELAPAQATVTGPRKVKVTSTSPRKAKLDLTDVGTLSDEALGRVNLSRPELVRLAELVTAGWPPTNTARLLSAEQAVLAWAYVGAKASKSGLAEEFGLGKKEWVVRDVVKSVGAVLKAVRTSHGGGSKTRHVHVSSQDEKSPEAAAGGAQDPVELESPDANMGEQGGPA
jgi:hypothetical protein